VQDLLPLYLEGEVSSASRETIIEHLARCERCAAFLAGAQSVRVQLRRDRGERERVIMRDAPVRTALGAGQRIVMLAAMLGLCLVGALSSLMIWVGMDQGGPAQSLVGMIIGLACFGGLAALARRQAELTPGRWLKLAAFSMVGALVPMLLRNTYDLGQGLAGLLLAVVALVGAWSVIVPAAQPHAD
jgi:predicted anti-sigma-YlaC factor YlaD